MRYLNKGLIFVDPDKTMDAPGSYKGKSFDDIVFENRNKQYGSYSLRRELIRHTWRSVVFIFLVTIVFIFGILAKRIFFSRKSLPEMVSMEITLSDPPQITQTLPPAVPPAVEKIKTSDLVEMEVKKDDEVQHDENPVDKIKSDTTSTGTEKDGSNNPSLEYGNGNTVYRSVEEMPEYPGGKIGLTRYLKDNLAYPKEAKENGIQGTVVVFFVVNEDGSVSDVKLKKGIGGGCDQEAIRIVSGMRRWKPGKQGGVPVKVYQQLPIVFKLQE